MNLELNCEHVALIGTASVVWLRLDSVKCSDRAQVRCKLNHISLASM